MNVRLYFVVFASVCYAISLFCGIFILEKSGPSSFVLGFVCLFFGWIHLAWYANPLLLAAIVTHLLKRDRIVLILAIIALLVALDTLTLDRIARDEAGNEERIVGYQIGFYLWLASIVSVLLSSLVKSVRAKRLKEQQAG